MKDRLYQIVKCNECETPNHVMPAGMLVPQRFIVTCKCGHFYEYFAQQVETMPMDFKPLRDLPKESKEGDLERMIERMAERETA